VSGSVTLSVTQHRPSMREQTLARPLTSSAAWACVVAGVAAVAYLLTLAPDLYSLDGPELSTAAYRLGIAHAPGYPFYTLAGWLFSHAFPISNPIFRMNLLSALFAVAACLAVYALALRLTARPAVAAAAALALAFSYWFWLDAIAAEVYSLDAALFAGMLLAAWEWRARPTPLRAAAVGLLFGLGLATRTTTALYLPTLVGFAWYAAPRDRRSWAAAAAGAILGAAFYLYLPLRAWTGASVGPGDYALDGSLRVWDVGSWHGFWRHVTASQFGSDAFAYGPADALREAGVFGVRLGGAFFAVGLPLGVAGAARLWSRDRAFLLLVLGCAAPLTLFFINYDTVDKEFMFLPAFVAWALLMAAGLAWALEASGVAAASPWEAAAFVLPALALVVNARLVTLHGEHGVRDDAEALLSRVAPDAIIYGPFIDLAAYQYLQQVEGVRPDVRLVNSWTADDAFLVVLAEANVGVRPFYVTENVRALVGRYTLVPVPGAKRAYEVRLREAGP